MTSVACPGVPAQTGIVYAFSAAGHREAYLRFFEARLGLVPLSVPFSLAVIWKLVRAKRLLFATISPRNAPQAMLVAFLRALLGKRTTAICMSGKWYLDRKRRMRSLLALNTFRSLHAIGRLDLFCIIPYQLKPEIAQTTSDWILDLFLWNLPAESGAVSEQESLLLGRIHAIAAGRHVLLYAGKASRRKRFERLPVLAQTLGSQVLIVAAGKVDEDCLADAERLQDLGMVVLGRFVSDEELIALFGIADYVWCCYDETQLSSGIFGLAVQLRKKAIVREGSYPERLAQFLSHPICYDLSADLASTVAPKASDHREGALRINGGEQTLAVLAEASSQKVRTSLGLSATC